MTWLAAMLLSVPQVDAPPAPPPKSPAPSHPDDVVVTGRSRPPRGDPLQAVNVQSFAATQAVDRAITGPAARAYARVLPSPIRSGLRNFLLNLHEPVVFVNYLLQLKPGKAAETVARFSVNSTIGAAGLFDVAKRRPFRLPRRPNGLADTLGYYGVRPGPFFFVPLIGPTTLRDLVGGVADRLLLPETVGGMFRHPAYVIATGVSRALDRRAEGDERITRLRDETENPYSAFRSAYLARRQAEIEHLHAHGRIADAPVAADAAPLIALPRPAPPPGDAPAQLGGDVPPEPAG